ncbi:pilus assembly protein [Aestuariivita sp.]|uniref:TadE/TadG family type IV pilus assembly protein n=1 Tax=Aestuariivita sp. TaxID=1872407 RepID=UPI0025B8BB74|nr:pilus assembly protein [Aestuariivita sp.]
MTVEFVLIVPILFWAYAASYAFFDGYRQSSINLKAAYTIGDLLSRERQIITPAYIDSMYALAQHLTRTDSPLDMRITVIRWDEEDDMFYFDWSQTRGSVLPLTQADLPDIAHRLPVMPDEERVILVETWNTWKSVVSTGMPERSFDNFIFTRPRFAPQLKFEDGT